jgi:predicted Zn-dependent protease
VFSSINTHTYTASFERVKDLEPPDIHYFSAADGWLGLSSPRDAQAELDKISKAQRTHLAVMELQWQVHAKGNEWERAIETARAITAKYPKTPLGWIHLAYALHEVRRTQEAYDSLAPILDQFREEWLMRYNMACYAVQLGNLDEGKTWLKRARDIGDKTEIEKLFATDPDLEPLRKAGKNAR